MIRVFQVLGLTQPASNSITAGIRNTQIMALLDPLPNEIALMCLVRVSFYRQPRLQLGCCSWRAAILSPEFYKVRKETGASVEYLCVRTSEPEDGWEIYDPVSELWASFPTLLPPAIRGLAHFGFVCTAQKLFLLGGVNENVDPWIEDHERILVRDDVWSYDPFLHAWMQCASMRFSRAMFACCVVDDEKIVLAGGFMNSWTSISKAEIYDPERDVWDPLPDLLRTDDSECFSFVACGKVYVHHMGIPSRVQIFDNT